MKRLSHLTVLLAACALVSWSAGSAPVQADEHPKDKEHPEKEHPTKEHPAKEHPDKEHPEHPEGAAVELTKDTLADAIAKYVAWDAKMHGGHFLIQDAKDGETLVLSLDKVHRERLASLGDGVYFACADFRATNGNVYDLDIFMKASPGGAFHGLTPTEVAVHKKNGKARYTWFEKDGIWQKKMQ